MQATHIPFFVIAILLIYLSFIKPENKLKLWGLSTTLIVATILSIIHHERIKKNKVLKRIEITSIIVVILLAIAILLYMILKTKTNLNQWFPFICFIVLTGTFMLIAFTNSINIKDKPLKDKYHLQWHIWAVAVSIIYTLLLFVL